MSLDQAEEIVIDNLTYNIENEELDEIKYFEILTMNEMIKDNPVFIAFSKEEIFDELFNFFNNTNKSEALSELFYNNPFISVENYVFMSDSVKKNTECYNFDDVREMITSITSYRKIQYNIAKNEIEKYFFALQYDVNSKNIRLKPYMKTNILLSSEENSKINRIFYPIYPNDKANIPISGAYYKIQPVTNYDYISKQVIGHVEKAKKINYVNSDMATDIEELIKLVKPKIEIILDNIDIDNAGDDIDHSTLDNKLHRFNTSFEDINIKEFEKLKEHVTSIIKNCTANEIKYKNYDIRKLKLRNDKLCFYNNIGNILKLSSISEKTKEGYDSVLMMLGEEKMQLNAVPLIYNDINDIVNAVNNNEIDIDSVIENIRNIRKAIVIDNAIKNIKTIQENTKESLENVNINLTDLVEKFENLKKNSRDLFELHFIDFHIEMSEIREGNDYSDYQGVPDEIKNIPKFENYNEVDVFDDGNEVRYNTNISLERFWLSTKYINNVGFVEMLKIILPFLKTIQEIAKIPIDYDLICNELFNNFSGIPNKYTTMKKILQKNNIDKTDKEIKDIISLNPNFVLNQNASGDNIVVYVKECNKTFVETLYEMFYIAIAKWCLVVQDNIVDESYTINENDFSPFYYEKWSSVGMLTDINSKESILEYVTAISYDVLNENNIYTVPKKIKESVINVINNKMKLHYKQIKDSNVQNIKKKVNKGRDYYYKLRELAKEKNTNDLLSNYINALMYMPEYKFQKHHKFLLGCCMQQIGNNFKAFNDMTGQDHRKYLLKSRKHFAKNRKTSQRSINIYYPIANIKKETHGDVIETYVLPKMKTSFRKKEISELFNEMRNKSSLLPDEIIDALQRDPRGVVNITEQYFDIFCKTANVKKKDNFRNMLLKNDVLNYQNILRLVCRVLQNQILIGTNDEELKLLKESIYKINDIMEHIIKIEKYINEYNALEIKKMIHYIIIISICLPFVPSESNRNNNILSHNGNEVSIGFVNKIVTSMYSALIEYLNITKLPTSEDNTNYQNSIRETNKNKILNTMNTQTTDERNLMVELKKIGLKHEVELVNDDMDMGNTKDDMNEYSDNSEDDDLLYSDEEFEDSNDVDS